MFDDEKRNKASILRTRQVIANKFKKLNRNRVIREKQLQLKYAPITNSVKKLIETKKNVSTENHRLFETNNSSNLRNRNETDLMEFEENDDAIDHNASFSDQTSGLDVNPAMIEHKPLNIKKEEEEMPRIYFNAFGDAAKYKENPRTQANVMSKSRKNASDSRKEKRAEASDTLRAADKIKKKYFGNTQRMNAFKKINTKNRIKIDSDIKNDRDFVSDNRKQQRLLISDASRRLPIVSKPYAGKRKRIINSIVLASKAKPKTVKKTRNVDVIRKTDRKTQRFDIHDTLRLLNTANRSRKKREIINSDYDADGNYLGPANKRRKVERKRKPKLVVMSPEDYGVDGSFVGIAKKRRKVEVPDDRMMEITQNIAKTLQKKAANMRRNKRINAMNKMKYGTCLETKFIPYAENIVYEHYDNPNEICERLKLLVSSKMAGNSNHSQEINSILEELRERHLIH